MSLYHRTSLICTRLHSLLFACHANISWIAENCRTPDWAGYLGLVLLYTGAHERKDQNITKAWVPQILGWGGDSDKIGYVEDLLNDPNKYLNWGDMKYVLEIAEASNLRLKQRYRRRKIITP